MGWRSGVAELALHEVPCGKSSNHHSERRAARIDANRMDLAGFFARRGPGQPAGMPRPNSPGISSDNPLQRAHARTAAICCGSASCQDIVPEANATGPACRLEQMAPTLFPPELRSEWESNGLVLRLHECTNTWNPRTVENHRKASPPIARRRFAAATAAWSTAHLSPPRARRLTSESTGTYPTSPFACSTSSALGTLQRSFGEPTCHCRCSLKRQWHHDPACLFLKCELAGSCEPMRCTVRRMHCQWTSGQGEWVYHLG